MASHISLWLLMAFFLSSSHAYTFEVGGKDGWTSHPSENYNNWSGRLRFLINDTLHFKYDGGSDSVLVVNKGDYDGCNTDKPITKLDGGDSSFQLDRSGPFYFISGNKSNCDRGQKLSVVVLAPRNRSPPSSTVSPPSPATLPPPPADAVSPSPSSFFPGSPSPTAESPGSTSTSPTAESPGSPSPSPTTESPGSPSPAYSPGGGSGLSPGGSVSPGSSPSGSASSPGGGSGLSPGPGGSNPADVNAPPPGSSATPTVSGTITASIVTMIFALWWSLN